MRLRLRAACPVAAAHLTPPLSINLPQLLITTMLTIGYGDIVPNSDGGRIFTVVGGVAGALLTAVTIALTTDYLQMSRAEAKVVSFLKKDANRKRVRAAATATLQTAFRYGLAKKKWKHHASASLPAALSALYDALEKFRNTKRWVAANDPVDPTDKQITSLEALEVNLGDVKGNLAALQEYFLEVRGARAAARARFAARRWL